MAQYESELESDAVIDLDQVIRGLKMIEIPGGEFQMGSETGEDRCLDWFDADYYSESPKSNPRGPDGGSYRVFRGGSWDDPARRCRSAYRLRDAPSDRDSILGFRVARSFDSK
jgi:formylglycine-generating enzyme required for sulfatase activity